MPSLLVVCTANVCRSLYAGTLLESRLPPDDTGWSVTTAGTDRGSGRPACELVAQRLSGGGAGHPVHTSRALTRADVLGADIILTAAKEHRRFVVELEPRASARTFTLLEAVRLSRLVADNDAATGWGESPAERWHAARPHLVEQPARSLFGRLGNRRSLSLDIADGHNIGPREHAATLDAVENAVAELSGAFLREDPRLRRGLGD